MRRAAAGKRLHPDCQSPQSHRSCDRRSTGETGKDHSREEQIRSLISRKGRIVEPKTPQRRWIWILRCCAPLLIAFASPAFAQTPKSDPEVHRLEREQQFLRGRTLPHQPAAGLLRRAYAQKLALRAARPPAAPGSTS